MFLDLVSRCVENVNNSGYIILMPEYRPDIARMIANHFGINFYDYREKEMLPLGWRAIDITLNQLNDSLTKESSHDPILAFNVEALLAIRPENERRKWFSNFIMHPWPNKILLPITIHLNEVPDSDQQTCNLLTTPLPEQTLINRLAF